MIIKKYDFTDFKLPAIKNMLEIAGKYDNINIYPPIGDHQLSILGAVNNIEFDGYILNIGTACQLCEISDRFIEGKFETRPFFFNKYLLTVTGLPGGDYIMNNDNHNLENYLYDKYKKAIDMLPPKNIILITGGVLKTKRELIINVVSRFSIDYLVNLDIDALNGLKILLKKENSL